MPEITCECDGEYVDGCPVKTSRYCPLHDDCELCGKRLGVMRDPTFDSQLEKRPMWLCEPCAKETVDLEMGLVQCFMGWLQ